MGSTAEISGRERKCPICKGAVGAREVNPAFPLCSERCRLIDLGRWLGEDYRVPSGDEDSEKPPDHEGGERGDGGVRK